MLVGNRLTYAKWLALSKELGQNCQASINTGVVFNSVRSMGIQSDFKDMAEKKNMPGMKILFGHNDVIGSTKKAKENNFHLNHRISIGNASVVRTLGLKWGVIRGFYMPKMHRVSDKKANYNEANEMHSLRNTLYEIKKKNCNALILSEPPLSFIKDNKDAYSQEGPKEIHSLYQDLIEDINPYMVIIVNPYLYRDYNYVYGKTAMTNVRVGSYIVLKED